MIGEIEATVPAGRERDVLLLAAVYHDVIYDPRAGKNEEASAALLLAHARDAHDPVVSEAWPGQPADCCRTSL
jgi:predicted metal-dependent HD superfamily phosphohydrolase